MISADAAEPLPAKPNPAHREEAAEGDPSGTEPRWRDFASIFLVSASLIIFQIAITRILSVVAWYHFAFLTLSLVMLGLGVPGVWFAMLRRPQRLLPGLLLVAGWAVPASAVALLRWGAAAREASVSYLVALVIPATLALGAIVCLLLMRARGASISRMYGTDLLGACLGAMAVIPLMNALPTPHLVVGCGLLPLLALGLYPGKARWVAGVAALPVIGLMFTDQLQVTRSKNYDETRVKPVYEKWSPTARIAVFDESFSGLRAHRRGFVWGKGKRFDNQTRVRHYWLEQDGSAGTPITAFAGDIESVAHLRYDITTLGHQLRPPQVVAVIGAGGGRDILSALLARATDVDAIELNRHTIEAVSGPFGQLSGDIYHAPGVHAVAEEGRSYLTRSNKRYDLIQISLIDSWAASAAGAFALAENNLYTTEAFESFGARLSDDGLLSTSRWLGELPRLIILARAALERMGVEQPERHLVLAAADDIGTLLLSKRAFEPSELDRLEQISAERGFERIYPVTPGQRSSRPLLTEMLEGRYTRMQEVGLSTRAPSDDSPYFFQVVSPFSDPEALDRRALEATGNKFNLASAGILRRTMFWVTALALALFFAPFAQRALRRSEAQPAAPLGRASAYFAAIGAGFMLFENVSIQRFVLYLGHPSHAATVILASLLLGMGVGAALSDRLGVVRLQRFGLLVPLLLAVEVALLPSVFSLTLGLPLAARISISCAVLVPTGALLGLFFPTGMLRFGDESKAWFWAINGAFGVVASVFSLSLSMQFDFTVVGYLSAAMYVLACGCLGWRVAPVRSVEPQEARALGAL